jgi:hypothetical protein
MRTLACAALALLAAAQSPADTDAADLRVPAPARPRAGMHGLQIESEIVLAEAPDDPHVLTVTFGFPDRARWSLRRPGAAPDRRIFYRFGEHGFALTLGETLAIALDEAERTTLLRRCALREAAFLWPDGPRWEEADGERVAAVHGLTPGAPASVETARPAAIGRLVVTLGADGRPARLESRDVDGALEETLEILEWCTEDGRTRPLRLRVALRGEPVWEEAVRSVDTGVRRQDRFFVPTNQQALLRPFARPLRLRLPGVAVRELPVGAGGDWPALLAWAERTRAAVAEELAPARELAPGFALVLAAEGPPSSLLLTLAGPPDGAPADWSVVAPRDAMLLVLGGRDAPAAEDLGRLDGAVPAGRTVARRVVQVGPNELRLIAELE